MRIALEVSALADRGAGVARYTRELLAGLLEIDPPLALDVLSNRPLARDSLPQTSRALSVRRHGMVSSRALWMQVVLPYVLSRTKPDLSHFTNSDAPLVKRVPQIVTVHDLSLLHSPELHPRKRVLRLARITSASARRADAVVCPSHSAREEALDVLGLDPSRVHVVSGAVAPEFSRLEDAAVLGRVLERVGVEPPFLLYVGTIEPRKNLVRLVRAYRLVREAGFRGQLVICGGWGWKSDEFRDAIADLQSNGSVVVTGYVDDTDLVALLSAAHAFVYPSLYEGFGLPIVEAFACGVPSVTSDRGAMAEVAKDAALLVDPESEEALAAALSTVINDEAVRGRLIAAGLHRARRYSRAAAAREAVATYRSVLEA